MNLEQSEANLGKIRVTTTSGRGSSVEEVTDRALAKLIQISDTASPPIRDQALAYREQMRHVLEFYMREAIRGNNTTLANRFHRSGYTELIPLILENE